MTRLLKALADALLVLFGVSTLVFVLLAVVPGDPVDVVLGESAQSADREAMREALGLNRPLVERWGAFYLDLLQGDLGESLVRREPVSALIAQRLPWTLALAGAALLVVLLISLPAGMLAARNHNRWPDRAVQVIALLGLSIPNFWLGPLFVMLFSIGLGWLPVSGNQGAASVVLPALTLGLSMAAVSTRMLRASLLEIMSQPYLRTARCKGLDEHAVMYRQALPNALAPFITVLGLQLGALLAGAVITEVVFAWPGIGTLLVDAIGQRDYPVVQGVVLVIAFGYVLSNRLADLLVARVDPRIGAADTGAGT